MRTERYNRKYSRISSLDELQTEIDKLDYKLELKEFEIRQDIEGVKYMFSLRNVTNMIVGSVPFSSITSGIRAGFSMVTSLFDRKKKKKRKKKAVKKHQAACVSADVAAQEK